MIKFHSCSGSILQKLNFCWCSKNLLLLHAVATKEETLTTTGDFSKHRYWSFSNALNHSSLSNNHVKKWKIYTLLELHYLSQSSNTLFPKCLFKVVPYYSKLQTWFHIQETTALMICPNLSKIFSCARLKTLWKYKVSWKCSPTAVI